MASSKNSRISKNAYFMKIAEVVSQRSTCVKRMVGAVLVKDSHIISTGYNGAPSGFKHCTPELCVRKILNLVKIPNFVVVSMQRSIASFKQLFMALLLKEKQPCIQRRFHA